MTLSVVIPVFNRLSSCLLTVRSILAQTRPADEIIVVDDGSSEDVAAAVSVFDDSRVRVHRHASNRGAAAARNTGFGLSRGDLVKFLDSDDILLPQALETEERTLKERGNGEACIIASGFYAVDHEFRVIRTSSEDMPGTSAIERVLTDESFLLPSSTLIAREICEALGGFDESLRYHEDRVFFTRAALLFPVYSTGQRLTLYRQSEEGKAREVATRFAAAHQAQRNLITAVSPSLDDQQVQVFTRTAINGVFCRSILYGSCRDARALYEDLDMEALQAQWKGRLALLSARSGVNILSLARRLYLGLSTPWRARRLPREVREYIGSITRPQEGNGANA